jgi:ABC-type transport system involved in Fe-S cluster assembly fused permease/ATPase subunit
MIYVVVDGKVVEKGRHNDLLAKKGAYADLCGAQALGTN